MGSSVSKGAKVAAGAATRKYPSRTPNFPLPTSQASDGSAGSTERATTDIGGVLGPTLHSQAQPSDNPADVIDLDARDPHLAASLRKLGPVQPFPTFSPSSTSSPDAFGTDANTPLSSSSQIPHSPNGNPIFPSPATNPALAILTARSRIAEAAEQEKVDFGKPGFEGRRFLDVATVRKALVLRDEQGMEVPEIERALGLARGVVGSLGRQGIVEVA